MKQHQAELIREPIHHLDNSAYRCIDDKLPDATCSVCKAVSALYDALPEE